jgi:hypothetical protein
MLFFIWSIEHDAWWRPGRMGYTTRLSEAGRYTDRESAAILERANYVAFNECRIPLAAVASDDAARTLIDWTDQ